MGVMGGVSVSGRIGGHDRYDVAYTRQDKTKLIIKEGLYVIVYNIKSIKSIKSNQIKYLYNARPYYLVAGTSISRRTSITIQQQQKQKPHRILTHTGFDFPQVGGGKQKKDISAWLSKQTCSLTTESILTLVLVF